MIIDIIGADEAFQLKKKKRVCSRKCKLHYSNKKKIALLVYCSVSHYYTTQVNTVIIAGKDRRFLGWSRLQTI